MGDKPLAARCLVVLDVPCHTTDVAGMSEQLIIGGGLILATCLTACLLWAALERVLDVCADWIRRPPLATKMAATLLLTLVCAILLLTVNVAIWAMAFRSIGVFETTEAATYFALVSFTSLGFGDVLLPTEWRLLGGMAASNGLLNFGIVTAMLIETMRSARLAQRGPDP